MAQRVACVCVWARRAPGPVCAPLGCGLGRAVGTHQSLCALPFSFLAACEPTHVHTHTSMGTVCAV